MPRRPEKEIVEEEMASDEDSDEANESFGEDDVEMEKVIDDIYYPTKMSRAHSILPAHQRLIIHGIDWENFKSYGGKLSISGLCKNFNGIVGPNGSGKSNIIDSLLFVFGFRSTRMRAPKLESFIHASAKLGKQDFASVRINFEIYDEQTDDYVPGMGFYIQRYVHRRSGSYYSMNNRKVTLKEVNQKLHEFGIDLRYNRFLILQGEVEQISLMKPKGETPEETGILEFFEDMVGTNRYNAAQAKLYERLNVVNEERIQAQNIAKLCYQDLTSTKAHRDEAIAAIKVDNEIKIERSKLLQHEMFLFSDQFKEIEDKFKKSEGLVREAQEKCKELDEQRKTLKEELKEEQKKKEIAVAKEIEYSKAFKECEQNDYLIQNKQKNYAENLKKLEKNVTVQEKELEKVNSKIVDDATFEEKLKKQESKIEKLQETFKENEEELTTQTKNAGEDAKVLIAKRDQVGKQMADFHPILLEKQSAILDIESKIKIIKEEQSQQGQKGKELATRIESVQKEEQNARENLQRYENDLKRLEKNQIRVKKEQEEAKNRLSQLVPDYEEKSSKLQTLRQKSENVKSGNKLKATIDQLVVQGRVHGYVGRVGDFGRIDPKYDIAVSTASSNLNNHCFENERDGAEFVKLTREMNMPSITLALLNKIKLDISPKQRYPENLPRLFDLIDIQDERLDRVFYDGIRDTLVAENNEQGMRVNAKGYRVVTLDGVLFENDGSMSGGGQPRKGLMGIQGEAFISQADLKLLDRFEYECNEMQIEIEGLQSRLRSCEQILQDDSDNIPKLREQIEQINQQLVRFAPRIKNLEDQQAEASGVDKNEQQRLEKEMKKLEQELEKTKKASESDEKQWQSMQEDFEECKLAIDEFMEAKLEPLKEKKNELTGEIDKAKKELSQMKVNHSKQNANLKNLTLKLESKRKELEDQKKMIEELEETYNAHMEKAEQTQTNLDAAKEALKEIVKIVMELEKKVSFFDKEYEKYKEEENNANIEILKIKKSYEGACEKRDSLLARMDAIKLTPYDENDKKIPGIELLEESKEVEDEESEEEENSQSPEKKKKLDPAHKSNLIALAETEFHNEEEMEVDEQDDDVFKIKVLSEDELEELNRKEIEKRIERLTIQYEKMKPNYSALEKYTEQRSALIEKLAELRIKTKSRNDYLNAIHSFKQRRRDEFTVGFKIIQKEIKEIYRTLTVGGDSNLYWVDSLDPFTEGINLIVRPRGKTWKSITNLSGGERTLASLALIFSVHSYKPSPLYVMDEIDAALDFNNVVMIGRYITQFTRNCQFIIISLREMMYEQAEKLIGVSKADGSVTSSMDTPPLKQMISMLYDAPLDKAKVNVNFSQLRKNNSLAKFSSPDISVFDNNIESQ